MKFRYFILFACALMVISGCELEADPVDEKEQEQTVEKLHVKFENSASSDYAITSIQTLVMEKAGGELKDPNGDFSSNYLPDGVTIAPGENFTFDIEMPNSFYAYCNLGIIDSLGNTIILTEQENYPRLYDGTITYWGSDERTVNVTIEPNQFTGIIMPTSWGEWAGIE